jgi:hypothetical protein
MHDGTCLWILFLLRTASILHGELPDIDHRESNVMV